MTVSVYLYERSLTSVGGEMFDGIVAMILCVDNAVDTTSTLRKARAVTVCRAAGRHVPLKYFDSEKLLNTLPSGSDLWAAAGDNTVIGRYQIDETIASVASGVEQEQTVND
jgi:hypothetical protein